MLPQGHWWPLCVTWKGWEWGWGIAPCAMRTHLVICCRRRVTISDCLISSSNVMSCLRCVVIVKINVYIPCTYHCDCKCLSYVWQHTAFRKLRVNNTSVTLVFEPAFVDDWLESRVETFAFLHILKTNEWWKRNNKKKLMNLVHWFWSSSTSFLISSLHESWPVCAPTED